MRLDRATLECPHTLDDADGTQFAANWVVTAMLGAKVLRHDGTNGHWCSIVQLIPQLKYAAYDVVNQGGRNGVNAAYEITNMLSSQVRFI